MVHVARAVPERALPDLLLRHRLRLFRGHGRADLPGIPQHPPAAPGGRVRGDLPGQAAHRPAAAAQRVPLQPLARVVLELQVQPPHHLAPVPAGRVGQVLAPPADQQAQRLRQHRQGEERQVPAPEVPRREAAVTRTFPGNVCEM